MVEGQVSAATAALPLRRTRKRQNWRHILSSYAYITPLLLNLIFLSAGPVLYSFFISFTNWQIVLPPVWVGVRNYTDQLASPTFWKVMWNTFYYTLGYAPLAMIVSLGMAIFVNQKLPGISFFRSLYFLPVVSSGVAVALVWGWIYHPSFGVLNWFLDAAFDVQGPRWLSDPKTALPSLIILGVWRSMGANMVIFLAGLQGVPNELYEAARIDGANRWREIRHVTIPLLTPTIFFVLIMSVIGSFQVWEATYLLTQGGPAKATLTISYYIFQQAFEWFHMGIGAALAYILFFVIAVITVIQFRLQRRWVFYR
ncbi:MAG: carbohydrate ABC transporter permease [Anaerolineae bacterium]